MAFELDTTMMRWHYAFDVETKASCAAVGVVWEDAARLDLTTPGTSAPFGKRSELLLGDDVALCRRHRGVVKQRWPVLRYLRRGGLVSHGVECVLIKMLGTVEMA